jgi:hypothetical protein
MNNGNEMPTLWFESPATPFENPLTEAMYQAARDRYLTPITRGDFIKAADDMFESHDLLIQLESAIHAIDEELSHRFGIAEN